MNRLASLSRCPISTRRFSASTVALASRHAEAVVAQPAPATRHFQDADDPAGIPRAAVLESLLITETARTIVARDFREVDMSLTGEDNENMQRMMAGLGMQVYRRYRVYERTIDDGR